MRLGIHERARGLVLDSLVEGLGEADRLWLGAHLTDCAACQGFAQELGIALRGLRLPEVVAGPTLLATTRGRVRAHARALADADSRQRLVIGSTALAFLSAFATGSTLVLALHELGEGAGLTMPVMLATATAVWFLPASVAALVVILLESRGSREARGLPEVRS